jgi:hypothetical protein
MKKLLLPLLSLTLFIGVFYLVNSDFRLQETENEKLRKQHKEYLRNSPFKETMLLTKKERKAKGLPPNKYFERQWELTMNPKIGRPEQEKLFKIQEELHQKRLFNKVPGENSNDWVERGPNNVGGRTRALMYDPNDATNKRVFAGGVSGGLWVNDDITNANSIWTEVNIPKNLAISCITYDPNNKNIFYVGTGESYVQGKVNGNGVWKSTNGGLSWSHVFGGITGETNFAPGNSIVGDTKVTINSPANIIGDHYGFAAAFGPSLTSLSGDIVLVNDVTGTIDDACEPLTNEASIDGKIALIRRGECNFTDKVKRAQNAGAIAVIIFNNISGDPIALGGDDTSITIPSMMLSLSDGQSIIDELGNGVNVSISRITSYAGFLTTPGVQHINDIVVRDIGSGNSEVYVAAGSTTFAIPTPASLLGVQDFGLYKSVDLGTNWSKFDLPAPGGYDYQPNDIEIAADNSIWFSTTGNIFRNGGGEILSSLDGLSFSLKHTIVKGSRTQIAVSAINAGTIYAIAELYSGTNGIEILKTTDGFATASSLSLPNDIAPIIPATDFTNSQAFYNLMIEVDPTNDEIAYVGGIDLFRTSDSGTTWNQISEYYSDTDLNTVHPDQHAMTFNPSSANQAIFGNDGGVYYGSDLAGSLSSQSTIKSRNKNYNTVQFYYGAIGQDKNAEKFLGGAQDNGSHLINNASNGINSSSQEVTGGDGGYCFIDKDNGYMISSLYNNIYIYLNYADGSEVYVIDNDQSSGDFINAAALDSNGNNLYSNGSADQTYQINRYRLNSSSAVSGTFTNVLLDGTPTALKTSPFTPTTLFVGTENGKLFKVMTASSKFKQTWTEIYDLNFSGSISSIEFGASEDDIYVTFYNYGVSNVFYSEDGGASWMNKEGDLPDIPVRAIMVNPLNSSEVIIGTDLGVWASSNFEDVNPNWLQSNNGMKDVVVTSFDLRISDNTVLAATYGRGMFTGIFTGESSTLAVDEVLQNDLINVYPTISNGTFKISSNGVIKEGTLKIFDANGRTVYSKNVNFDSNRAQDISLNASAGIYVAKFSNGELTSTYKIIIQ